MIRFAADAEVAGRRIDAWAAAALGVSRARATALLVAGALTLNGKPAKPDRKVAAGDVLEGEPPADLTPVLAPEKGKVPIVFQDAHLLVVDKPAGLTVHPGSGRPGGTLVNILLGMKVKLAGAAGPARPGIVHRLDRETSGLMVLAKTDAAYWKLVAMIQRRRVHREYVAFTRGVPAPAEGTIEGSLGRDPRHPERFAVVTGGKPAVTRYEVAEPYGTRAAMVRVTLGTGRTHQIRVHFAAMGWPLLGDPLYGGAAAAHPAIDRQALHAAALAFPHPVSDKPLEFTSPLPGDLKKLRAILRAEPKAKPALPAKRPKA